MASELFYPTVIPSVASPTANQTRTAMESILTSSALRSSTSSSFIPTVKMPAKSFLSLWTSSKFPRFPDFQHLSLVSSGRRIQANRLEDTRPSVSDEARRVSKRRPRPFDQRYSLSPEQCGVLHRFIYECAKSLFGNYSECDDIQHCALKLCNR